MTHEEKPANDLHSKLADLIEREAPELKWTLSEDNRGISLSIFYDRKRAQKFERERKRREKRK